MTNASSAGLASAELSVIVPTFNERANVEPFLRRLETALSGVPFEVVFVDDDSPDGTATLVRSLARNDPRVRCVHRIGRRGLASACVEGILATSAPFVAVMDADLQHDESALPAMLQRLRANEADLVVGTRYADGGSTGEWDRGRERASRFATWLSRTVTRTSLSDPMSGFFALRREAFEDRVRDLSAIGFKILLDLVASGPETLRVTEVPYQFRSRVAGESKLDSHVAWDFGMLLLDKTVGPYVPPRFVVFALVGSLGVLVHLLAVALSMRVLKLDFVASQALASAIAMVGNFLLNNLLTYRDQRLRGFQVLRGLFSFVLISSVGALANVGVASFVFRRDSRWVIASLAGIAVGAVWNFAVSQTYTWKAGRPRPPRDVLRKARD